MLNSYIELNFDVIKAATGNRYADADDILLAILAPIALFSNYKLTTSIRKHLENIDHAPLMYKILPSSGDSDDLSTGFDRSRDGRKRELTNNNKIKGKYHLRIYLKEFFGFAEHQKTGTFGLGYKLPLTRNTDNTLLNKDYATNNAIVKISGIEWYVPHYVPSLEEFNNLLNQTARKTPTNLQYPEKSVFMKEVNIQHFWSIELGSQAEENVPIWIHVVFQQHGMQHDQNLNNDTFYTMPVTSAQCFIGIEKYPDNAILLNYDDHDYSQRHGQIKEDFTALTKDNIL